LNNIHKIAQVTKKHKIDTGLKSTKELVQRMV